MWFAASMLLASRGGGSPDLRSVDFPLVQGSLLFQGQRGGGAAARRHSVLFVVLGVEVQKVFLVIFFFVLDWSVRSAVNQYQFLAKKKHEEKYTVFWFQTWKFQKPSQELPFWSDYEGYMLNFSYSCFKLV
jgi:hypothetical protein